MLPEMLVGCVLEMVTGSELTPKGGLKKLVAAFEAKLERPKPSGAFGDGAYKDEPWALVSIRARVTAARVFYDSHLGTKDALVNPGYSEILSGAMASISLLIGEHAEHVSWPLAHCERARGACTGGEVRHGHGGVGNVGGGKLHRGKAREC